MSPEEKRSVKNKIPYFDEHSIVIDVGSCKGEFTDLLIDSVDEIHLLEPNSDLLTYTRIKYAGRENVSYSPLAAYSERGKELTLYSFSNQHNGLSSLYDNPAWSDLPGMVPRSVITVTIDGYCEDYKIDHIDFLKIDVEGAELDVLKGCRRMLKSRSIKYIQLEYSPHYQVPGYTFKQVIEYLNSFGYGVYSFEGVEWTVDTFIEDYRLDNFLVRLRDFTEDWNSEFRNNTEGLKFDFALEIGCFEGLTSVYICNNLLRTGGRMICVDPLEDEYLTENLREEDKKTNADLPIFKGQFQRFKKNTKGKPIELIRKTSEKAFPKLKDYKFDFIYIDGDHRREAVYNDGIKSFDLLKAGGYLLFDDYEWREETKEGINRFLHERRGYYEPVVRGYQIMIKKKNDYVYSG